MPSRSTNGGSGKRPHRFNGATSNYRVSGKATGDFEIAFKEHNGRTITRIVTDSTVVLKIEAVNEETAELPMLIMPWDKNGTGAEDDTQLNSLMKRVLQCDKDGKVADTTIVFLSLDEFRKAMGGPQPPVVPIKEINAPYARCVEYYDLRGDLARTEWSTGIGRRAA
jgi:hypothetical protein